MYLFTIYHWLSKNRLSRKIKPGDENSWPPEWKKICYKSFPDKRLILLEASEKPEKTFLKVLSDRKSKRSFVGNINKNKLSTILYFSLGEYFDEQEKRMRRFYPSGGARYPIESYIIVIKSFDDLRQGVYHYSVGEHGLHVLKEIQILDTELASMTIYDFVKDSHFMIVSTAVFERSSIKYKERAYRYVLLEAGAIMQNLCLVSSMVNIAALPMAGAIDDYLETLIGIDGRKESIVNVVVFG